MNIQTSQINQSGHAAEALVLNCMDYRLVGKATDYLEGIGLAGRYDLVSMAGGALGVMLSTDGAWAKAFWDQLTLARDLHGIRRLIAIDHRDCGACREFVGSTCSVDAARETEIHRKVMTDFAVEVERRMPGLEVELLLMDLQGNVEVLG